MPSVSETVDSLHASGVGRLDDLGNEADTSIAVQPVWHEGQWSVVFVRRCNAEVEGEVSLEPGSLRNVAVAVWDGSAGDRGAQKSISIWQALELEP